MQQIIKIASVQRAIAIQVNVRPHNIDNNVSMYMFTW